MKKGALIVCAAIIFFSAFMLGWRVMPRFWPGIREAVVYPVFPQLRPEPELYTPGSSASLTDKILDTDSLIYYFYKDYCPHCRELDPLISGLPSKITLPDGRASAVKLVCINKADEQGLELITGYYETRGIPEERRYVPAIVIGDRYLFTSDEIIPQLMDALEDGEGLHTRPIDGTDRMK